MHQKKPSRPTLPERYEVYQQILSMKELLIILKTGYEQTGNEYFQKAISLIESKKTDFWTLQELYREEFQQLDPATKQSALQNLVEATESVFDYDKWWKDVEALQISIQSHLDENETTGALSLLDELREEAS